jgi:hypothetical protein
VHAHRHVPGQAAGRLQARTHLLLLRQALVRRRPAQLQKPQGRLANKSGAMHLVPRELHPSPRQTNLLPVYKKYDRESVVQMCACVCDCVLRPVCQESSHPLFRSGDGLAALQDFHKWRCIRMLYERVYTKVTHDLWRRVFAQRPDLLTNLYGNDAHPGGVTIDHEADLRRFGEVAAWSVEHGCWVGTMADFTGRMP